MKQRSLLQHLSLELLLLVAWIMHGLVDPEALD